MVYAYGTHLSLSEPARDRYVLSLVRRCVERYRRSTTTSPPLTLKMSINIYFVVISMPNLIRMQFDTFKYVF